MNALLAVFCAVGVQVDDRLVAAADTGDRLGALGAAEAGQVEVVRLKAGVCGARLDPQRTLCARLAEHVLVAVATISRLVAVIIVTAACVIRLAAVERLGALHALEHSLALVAEESVAALLVELLVTQRRRARVAREALVVEVGALEVDDQRADRLGARVAVDFVEDGLLFLLLLFLLLRRLLFLVVIVELERGGGLEQLLLFVALAVELHALLAVLVVLGVLEDLLLDAEELVARDALLDELGVAVVAVELADFAREELLARDRLLARLTRRLGDALERAEYARVQSSRTRNKTQNHVILSIHKNN